MKKAIVIGVIALFIIVGFQPTYANIMENHSSPPYPPTITGPDSGKPGQTLAYTFNAGDPFSWNVRFHIDWGDGNSEWTKYVHAGEDITIWHIWDVEDTYTITAYAQNEYGENSSETTKQVIIPRDKQEDCDCQESPIVNSFKANTELKVEDIYVKNNFLKADNLRFIVRNTGDTATSGSYYIVIERLLFATLVIKTVYDYGGFIDTLKPGDTKSFKIDIYNFITPGYYIEKIFTGFYMVHVYLFPNYPNEGFDYCNEKFFAIGFGFTNWFQCY